jgi:hypothetical protein
LNARHRVVGEDQNTVSIELSLPHRAIPGQGSATFIRNLELGNVLICAIRAFDPSIGRLATALNAFTSTRMKASVGGLSLTAENWIWYRSCDA